MEKKPVFVTRRIPQIGLDMLEPHCDLEIWPEETPPPAGVLCEKIRSVVGLLCLLTEPIAAGLMDAGRNLQVISQMAVGVDNVDLAAATTRRLPVGHTPGVLTEATADMAFTLLMTAARRIPEGIDKVQRGDWRTWEPMGLLGADVWGATLGIIGLGRIGQAVARRAQGFRMRVLYHDSQRRPELEAELNVQPASMDQLLAESDFVSLHCPLTPETTHLIDAAALQAMKPTAILINTSRGPVVDPDALVEGLRQGWILRAALDVTDPEPIPADHPLVQMPNCIVAPHIASATVTSRNKMSSMAAENLLAGLRGERLPYCANPAVYDKG